MTDSCDEYALVACEQFINVGESKVEQEKADHYPVRMLQNALKEHSRRAVGLARIAVISVSNHHPKLRLGHPTEDAYSLVEHAPIGLAQ